LLNGDAIWAERINSDEWTYTAEVPSGTMAAERIDVQVEGCRRADIGRARGEEWIKEHRPVQLAQPEHPRERASEQRTEPREEPIQPALSGGAEVKLYFGIHKHMHQPHYNTTDRNAWDGEKDEIFGSRAGNYSDFIPAAVQQYIDGGLAHAGLSTS
jgi:hypothetical protein